MGCIRSIEEETMEVVQVQAPELIGAIEKLTAALNTLVQTHQNCVQALQASVSTQQVGLQGTQAMVNGIGSLSSSFQTSIQPVVAAIGNLPQATPVTPPANTGT
jgi:hypothetical protein